MPLKGKSSISIFSPDHALASTSLRERKRAGSVLCAYVGELRDSDIQTKGHVGTSKISMPALSNPRHERYAQLIVEALANGEPKPYSQSRAYIAAGYTAKDPGKPGSAQAASSRLLYRVINRVRELQQIGAKNAVETVEKMARELNRNPVRSKSRQSPCRSSFRSARQSQSSQHRRRTATPSPRFPTSQFNGRYRAKAIAVCRFRLT